PTKHGPEFNAYLKKANIFLHPSTTTEQNDKEGIPGAIVEAMASGLPVIATWHGGIPSVITDGTTGFLVKENDSDDIARIITNLYRDEHLRKTIGTNAARFAQENLDMFEKGKLLKEIYDAVAPKPKKSLKTQA
ncbi:MAG: glycosyltransferase, partial [Flavobacteriaceae bacterium]